MGQSRIIPAGWLSFVSLLALTLAVACEGQPTGSDPSPSNAEPSNTEPLVAESDATPPPPNPGPPPPPAGAFLAQLPPAQTSQLANLGVEVVVPGAVPATFSVVEIRTDQPAPDSANPAAGTSYIVVYQDSSNRCFAVEFATDGIGDPPATESRLPIQPPLFGDQGYGLNYGAFAEEDMQAQFPGSNLYTDWLIGPSGAYRLVGAAYIGSLFQTLASCEDIDPQAAVSIVESFTVLSPEDVGDGQGVE